MARKKQNFSVTDISGILKDGLSRAVSRPSIYGYVPHDKQIKFHTAPEKGRLYIGGNRSGKTVGGTVEDIWWLRGQHPYRQVPPPPVRGRIVTTSFNEGVKQIIIPELAKWIPPSDLINGSWEDSYAKQDRQLTLANGSTCELMSYDQDVDKFAGTSRHFTHFDEEPPKPIFDECKMRLLDTQGYWWMTMTPVLGMTWVYDDIYEPGLSPGSNIAVIAIDTSENPYLSSAEVEAVFADFKDEKDVQARKEGKFVQIGGLVFKYFDKNRHVIAPLSDRQLQQIMPWTHYASLDHGLNNPTAWLFHAVAPNGTVITYDEIYDREKMVAYYAASIKERVKLPGRRAPDVYIGDPAIAQRNAQTMDSIQVAYAQEGIPVMLGNNDVKIGVNKMNAYFYNNKWLITENCQNLIRELQRVRWKVYESQKKRYEHNLMEEIHKKDDHAPDSARYMFSLLPDLFIPPIKSPRQEEIDPNELIRQTLSAVTPPVGREVYDTNLSRPRGSTEWHTIDEHLGGWN